MKSVVSLVSKKNPHDAEFEAHPTGGECGIPEGERYAIASG